MYAYYTYYIYVKTSIELLEEVEDWAKNNSFVNLVR